MGLKGNRTGSIYGCGYWVGFGSGGYIYIGCKTLFPLISLISFSLFFSHRERSSHFSLLVLESGWVFRRGSYEPSFRRGGRRPEAAAPPRRRFQTPPFFVFFALSSLFPLFYPIRPLEILGTNDSLIDLEEDREGKKENTTLSFWICFVVVRMWCWVRWYVRVLWFMCCCVVCVSLWATAVCWCDLVFAVWSCVVVLGFVKRLRDCWCVLCDRFRVMRFWPVLDSASVSVLCLRCEFFVDLCCGFVYRDLGLLCCDDCVWDRLLVTVVVMGYCAILSPPPSSPCWLFL